jgi:signal transduction histidine kinase
MDNRPVTSQYRLLTKTGEICWLEERLQPVRDEQAGRVVKIYGAAQDVTQRKHMEKQLMQVEKGESLSRMAGAVAHHFNNILMVTIGYLELAQEDIPQDSLSADSIREAAVSAKRAVELSQLMLTYLGQGVRKNEIIDLSEFCRQTITDISGMLPGNIELIPRLTSQRLRVESDQNHLERLVKILFENAVEALAKKPSGKISITLEPVESGSAKLSDISGTHLFPNNWRSEADSFARLSVSDTGKGMDEETIDLIFDPFYSDKFTGRGLGLAVALGIVKSYGGCICVKSKAGQGTEVIIFLPMTS